VKRFLVPLVGVALVAAIAGTVPVGAAPQQVFTSTHTKQRTIHGNQIRLQSRGSVNMAAAARSQTKASKIGKPSKAAQRYLRFRAGLAAQHAGNSRGLATPKPNAYFTLSTSGGPGMIFNRRGIVTTESANANGFDVEPPDQGLCANSSWVLEGVNLAFQLYPANGGAPVFAAPIAMNTFFGLDASWFTSDPKCFFDPGTKLWYASALSINSNFDQFYINLAVSNTSDASGTWSTYALNVSNDGHGGVGCPCLGDQPLLGVDANGIYITTNSYTLGALFGTANCDPSASGCFNGAQVYAISKSALFHGLGIVGTHYDTYGSGFPGTGGNSQVYTLQPTESQSGNGATTQSGTEWLMATTDWCAAPSACPGDVQNAIIAGGITGTNNLNATPPFTNALVLLYTPGPINYEFPQLGIVQKTGPIPLGSSLGDPEEPVLSNDDRMNQSWLDNAGNVWAGANSEIVGTNGKHVGLAYWDVHPAFTSPNTLTASFVHYGYIAHKTQSVWFPGFAVGPSGDPTVALELAGTANYPSTAYTTFVPGPRATGTIYDYGPGTNPEDGFTCYPQFHYGPPCRWGDYSAAAVMSNGTVWVGSENIPPTKYRDTYTNWGTRFAHVQG
jgi:hypothetical protein